MTNIDWHTGDAIAELFRFMAQIDWNMIAAIAQILGFAGVVWGLIEGRRTMQTQVAMEFYRRYEEISAQMPDELRLAAYQEGNWASLERRSQSPSNEVNNFLSQPEFRRVRAL